MSNGAKKISQINKHYPSWCHNRINTGNKVALLKAFFFILNEFKDDYKQFNKCIRELVNKLYGCFERIDGFYYGISEGVTKLTQNRDSLNPKDVIVEHAVPVDLIIWEIVNQIKNGKIENCKQLEFFLQKHYYVCIITKDEDNELNRMGLRRKMPNNCGFIEDWKARYKSAGIKLSSEPKQLSALLNHMS